MISVDLSNVESIESSNHLYQWDKGQQLEIKGLGVSKAPEIHFGVNGSMLAIVVNSTLSGGIVYANIPNEILMSGKDLRVYVHIDGTTIKNILIPVFKRNMPENYVVDCSNVTWIEEFETEANEITTEKCNEIEAKGTSTLESIPDDYTALSNEVTDLKSDLSEQTRNLLNSKIYTTDDFEYVNGVFRNIKTDSRAYTQLYILQYSDSTLISTVCNIGIANGGYKRIYQFEASEGVNRIRIGHNGAEKDLKIYFDDVNLISGETYTISVFLDGNDPTTVGGLTFKDIQIEVGNTASDYIPMFSATDYILREKYNKEVSSSVDMWNDSVDILKTSCLTIVDKTVLNNNVVSSSASGITAFVKLTEGETYYFTRGIVDNRALYIGFSDGAKMGANLIGFKQVKDQENYKLQEDGYNPFVFTVPNGYPYFAFTYYFTGYETKSYTASEILNSFSLFKYKYHMIDADNRNILNDIVNPLKILFENEINRVVSEAKSKMSSKCMCIGIITDTHIDVTNDIYNKISMFNMKSVNEYLNFDICANLGDVIDGGETKEIETKFMSEGIRRIVKVGAKKCFAVLGNHDNNGLGSELFTDEEIYGNMLQFSESEVIRDGITSNFYVDYESLKIRIIVVDSCYNTQGFSDTTVYWITDVLANTPNDYKFVILSHEPTRGSLISTTSSESFNSANIEGVLDNYKDRICGYIHGHTHFDNVSYVNGYPEISITCGQPYQYPSTNSPSGATAPERIIGSITQDAWDIVLVLPEEGKFEFIRFGAGESRTIPFRQ